MYGRISKSLNIVNLYRGMSKLKLKINVKDGTSTGCCTCIVVSVALNGEFERFGGLCVHCYYTLKSPNRYIASSLRKNLICVSLQKMYILDAI